MPLRTSLLAAGHVTGLAANVLHSVVTVPAGHVWIVKTILVKVNALIAHTTVWFFAVDPVSGVELAITVDNTAAVGNTDAPHYGLFVALPPGASINVEGSQNTTDIEWHISGEDLVQF